MFQTKVFSSKLEAYTTVMKNFMNEIHLFHHQTDEYSKQVGTPSFFNLNNEDFELFISY